MKLEIEERLSAQGGVVAAWQLRRDGHSERTIQYACSKLRRLHRGVFLSGHAPVTPTQRWRAATLTAPGSVLSHESAARAAAFYELRGRQRFETITRPGRGGPRREGSLLVYRSTRFGPDVRAIDGIPAMTSARTVLDLIPDLADPGAARLVRDALRLRAATPAEFRALLGLNSGRRGVARLRALVDEYAQLPGPDARSDAEFYAAALITAAGIDTPMINAMHAGGEADLSWLERMLIIELDSKQHHPFPQHDAIKQARWERAGWTVRRLPTDDVYKHPELLIARAAAPTAIDIARNRRAELHR